MSHKYIDIDIDKYTHIQYVLLIWKGRARVFRSHLINLLCEIHSCIETISIKRTQCQSAVPDKCINIYQPNEYKVFCDCYFYFYPSLSLFPARFLSLWFWFEFSTNCCSQFNSAHPWMRMIVSNFHLLNNLQTMLHGDNQILLSFITLLLCITTCDVTPYIESDGFSAINFNWKRPQCQTICSPMP